MFHAQGALQCSGHLVDEARKRIARRRIITINCDVPCVEPQGNNFITLAVTHHSPRDGFLFNRASRAGGFI